MKVSGQLHAPAALSQGRALWYPLDRRLGGPQNQSGHDGEKKNSHFLPGLEPAIIQPVAQRYTTELYMCVYIYIFFNIGSLHWNCQENLTSAHVLNLHRHQNPKSSLL
jgi:hypothetical protein